MPNYGNGSPGNPLPTFDLDMTDDALITLGTPTDVQGPTAVTTFTDVGFMPVTPQSVAGSPLHLPAWADGLFVQYTSDGKQDLYNIGTASNPDYIPTAATYTDLHYELIAYSGTPTFGHAADGTPTVTGILKEAVVAQGDLISGCLDVDPVTQGISGSVLTTMQISGKTVGNLDIGVSHTAKDIGLTPSGFTLSGPALQASFMPVTSNS